MGTKSNDAKELLESITHSNFCELQFMYDNLRREVRIQLPISLDNEEEKPAGWKEQITAGEDIKKKAYAHF